MTDSKIYKNLSKETFFDDNTEHTNITEPENYTELVDNYTNKINGKIDTYLNGISDNMTNVKKRGWDIQRIDKNVNDIFNKLNYSRNQNKLYNTNGVLI
jgi:hypothetical protein